MPGLLNYGSNDPGILNQALAFAQFMAQNRANQQAAAENKRLNDARIAELNEQANLRKQQALEQIRQRQAMGLLAGGPRVTNEPEYDDYRFEPKVENVPGIFSGLLNHPVVGSQAANYQRAAQLGAFPNTKEVFDAHEKLVQQSQKGANEPFYYDASGKLVPNEAYQKFLKEKAALGASKVDLRVDNNIPFGRKLQENMAESLVKEHESLQNIPDAIATLQQAKAAIPKAGSFVGGGAEAKLTAVKFLNANLGTNIAPEQIANAEILRSASFRQIMDNLKKMDAQPTEKQQQALQQALGSIGTDPNALPKIIDITIETLVNRGKRHNQRVEETTQSGIKFPYSIRVDIPEQTTQPTRPAQRVRRYNPQTGRIE